MNKIYMLVTKANHRLDNNILQLSKDCALYLRVQNRQNVQLYVGKQCKVFKILVRKSDKSSKSMSMNPEVLKRLHLRSNWKYGVSADKDIICLGPVVGIMADTTRNSNKPFGAQTYFIKQLLTAGRNLGEISFAFDPSHVNWEKETITGYNYGKNGWVKAIFPIPDVVYPRAKGVSSSKISVRRRLEEMGVVFLNPVFVGKWQTYRIISQNPALAPYIPDTRLIKNFDQLDKMISKYQAVYLKPVSGSQGRNIIKVVKGKNSSVYQYQYQYNGKTYSGTASSLSKLKSYLKKVMRNRPYIIQKQINLLRLNGNLIDVRVLVQKDHSGIWGVTGMACRVGRQGSITSNICSGGKGQKVETILKNHFSSSEKIREILEEIDFLVIESARTLEESIGQSGEMGVDVGIDKNGKIWFIETNIRPGRQVFDLIGEKELRKRSVEKPLLYSRYLAGF
jgi:glutathione synthase/RimK-type ligase-like ATP-grasp enzyme